MKFLKVLSTSAIAAALLASMSVNAFAADDDDVELDDDIIAEDFEEIADDEEDIFGEDDDAVAEDEIVEDEIVEDTGDVENADDVEGVFEETADDDNDTVAEEVEGAADDADCFFDLEDEFTFGKGYDWSKFNWEDVWSTEFAPEGIPANPTVFDVVAAAQNSGVNSLNIQSLSNFLILNEDEFTSDDYAAFIATCYAMREAIIDDHVAELFPGKTAGSLTEQERYTLYNSLNRDEKDAISAALINLGNAHRILVSFDTDAEGYPVIYASMRHRIAATEVSSAANAQVAAGSAVAATGGELPETGSAGAAAFAGIALGLAAVGAVIVSRKNRA